jgi:hypothetical protein
VKSGFKFEDVIYNMSTPLVHQLLSCLWLSEDLDVVMASSKSKKEQEIEDLIFQMETRRLPKFNF